MPFKKLEILLGSGKSGNLGKIIQRAQNMGSLTTALKKGVAPELAENLLAATLNDDGQMVVICSSQAWASRLRFEADMLLTLARDAGVNVDKCIVRVSR